MKKIIIIFCFLSGISSFSQIKISGKVTDSIGNPLELANIILIDAETDILESFGTSNEKGEYKIQLRKNKSYNFQVSYIVMATFSQLILSKEQDIVKNVKLNENNILDTVQLTYEMPVVISGDTLIYDADSFKTGTERKLEDVLKNLPGVEINDDGEIEGLF